MRMRGQQLHFVTSDLYDRLVPGNHFLRRLAAVVDFTFVDELCRDRYRSALGGPGRPAEPPQRLFKLLLVMFLYQVKFERELERRVSDTLSWRWFCGYEIDDRVASHKTLWAFRNRLGPELFDDIFARVVEQCIQSGLVNWRRWHADATAQNAAGTRVSQFDLAVIVTRAMIARLESMQGVQSGDEGEPPRELDDEMKRLVAEAASKASRLKGCGAGRVLARAEDRPYDPPEDAEVQRSEDGGRVAELDSLARELAREQAPAWGDTDARIGHTSAGHSFCGYLTTAVVDEKCGLVVGYHTFAGNVDQQNTFFPAYESALRFTGRPPSELAADSAFDTVAIRQRLKADGVQGYIPMLRSRPDTSGGCIGDGAL